ncbi:MAG: hypothetical protein ABJZ55_06680 [Fuerstiella sp.]
MKNPIKFCLQIHIIAICIAGLPTCGMFSVAVAQDGTMSHRRLELPRNSPSEPQEQLARLLQYIQSLKGEDPSSKQQDSTEADRPTLSQLKQAMGPELSSMLDSLPPNVVNDAMKDPAIRSQVKDMLQQFSKEGTLPDFINRPKQNRATPKSDSPSPRTGQSNRPRTSNGNTPPNTSQNIPRFGPPKTNPDIAQRPGAAGSDAAGSDAKGSQQNAQDRLKDLIQQLRQRNSLQGNTSRSDNGQPGRPSTDQAGSQQIPESSSQGKQGNSNAPMTESQWEERLRQLMQKQRDSVRNQRSHSSQGNAISDADLQTPNGTASSGQNSGNNAQAGSDLDSQNRTDTDNARSTNPSQLPGGQSGNRRLGRRDLLPSQQGFQPAPSMSEFLEQMRDAPAPDLKDLGVDFSAAGQKKNKGSQGNLIADAIKQMDPQELREQAKKALQDKGFRNTLKNILKDAKQSAKQEAGSGDSPSDMIANIAAATGMEDTVLEALGGMTEELVEIAKDAKFQNSKSDNASHQQGSPNSSANESLDAAGAPDDSKPKPEKSVFGKFTESASKAINNFSEAPSASASDSVTTDMLPDLGGGNFSTLVFILLLIIGLIGCLFVGSRLMPVNKPETSEQVLATLIKQGIRSKEDVIKAFHQFALKPPHETQHWWTHSKVVETVVHQYPQHSARIQLLAALYEQARYFPADSEFTDAQIQQAADAVRTVGVA